MRTPPHIALTEEPDREDVLLLEERLYEYNVGRTGIADGRVLALFARDDDGSILGGLHGWTWGKTCEIRSLWVAEPCRRQGLGSQLLSMAEYEARVRGARQILLMTHSFQAPAFYRRFGFEIVAGVSDYPIGHDHLLLRKML
jgi:ribosomal protein S18 acetylase RimI-like enzyme